MAVIVLILFSYGCQNGDMNNKPGQSESALAMITHADQSKLLEEEAIEMLEKTPDGLPIISIETEITYQKMDGFGYTLTGGSALHLHQMSAGDRKSILEEMFSVDGIGVSYLRVSIGASDLDNEPFSYNDLPEGEVDSELTHFDLAADKAHLIPVLKEILAINPAIKIMGSPWSPPKWMKENKDTRGGSLLPEFYPAYAQYFIKYIEEMAKEGIPIDAITVQNEPLHPGNNPSLLMHAEDQADFIKDHLGPAFERADIDTKIIIYDHNADRPDYPITILNDPQANKYVDGSAFHLYNGQIEALTEVHNAHPDKNLYFTEQWIGAPGDFPENLAWHTKELIIEASRNWCKTVLEWNLAADENQDPHTDRGGCDRCLGAITINGNEVTRNPAYYIIAHASKYVRPGSVRVGSNLPDDLPNVAFKTPDNKVVVVVLNESESDKSFAIDTDNKVIPATLKPGAVGTYIL